MALAAGDLDSSPLVCPLLDQRYDGVEVGDVAKSPVEGAGCRIAPDSNARNRIEPRLRVPPAPLKDEAANSRGDIDIQLLILPAPRQNAGAEVTEGGHGRLSA